MIDLLCHDLRFALRSLRRRPGFTAVAVLTLALGIGANSAVFSLADAALLRPLPYPGADRLVVLWENYPAGRKEREKVSAANFLDRRRDSRSFSGLAAWRPWGAALTGSGEPEELNIVRASAGLLDVLGVAPVLGRGFTAEEETRGRHRVVLLSHGVWTGRFGSDPGVIGRSLTLDGEPHRIIGVMPPEFRFPDDGAVAMWAPLAFDGSELVTRAERRFQVLGRLAPAADLDAARSELATIAARLGGQYPATNAGWGVTLLSAGEAVAARSRRPLGILLGAAVCVLLIACANVGHLFRVRAIDRERELAVRVALGAGPAGLVRLLLLEGALVTVMGGLAGLAIAGWTVPLVGALDPGLIPSWRRPELDGTVFLFAAGVLASVTLACGLLPAIGAVRAQPRGARAGGRLSRGLIVGEAALAIVLLVGAGLLLRSLLRLQRVDPGFDPDRVLAATIFLTGAECEEDARQAPFFADLLERLRGLPGVRAAGAVTTLPMNPIGIDYDLPFSLPARPDRRTRRGRPDRVLAGAATGSPRAGGGADRAGAGTGDVGRAVAPELRPAALGGPGFRSRRRVDRRAGAVRYDTPARVRGFYAELVRRLEQVPGVQSAAAVRALPMTGRLEIGDWSFIVEGRHSTPPTPADRIAADWQTLTPHYFQSLRIPVLQGRGIEEDDRLGATRVVVINRTLARQVWPAGDAPGRRILLGGGKADSVWRTVVGVVGDVRHRGLSAAPARRCTSRMPSFRPAPRRLRTPCGWRSGPRATRPDSPPRSGRRWPASTPTFPSRGADHGGVARWLGRGAAADHAAGGWVRRPRPHPGRGRRVRGHGPPGAPADPGDRDPDRAWRAAPGGPRPGLRPGCLAGRARHRRRAGRRAGRDPCSGGSCSRWRRPIRPPSPPPPPPCSRWPRSRHSFRRYGPPARIRWRR